jgi:Type II secretion system (T2SS), protein G
MVIRIKSRESILIVAAGIGACLLTVRVLLPAASMASMDTLSVRKARELIQNIAGAHLNKDSVQIKDIAPGVGGGEVVVEARIDTAFRVTKEHGDWRITDVRLGDRQWESFDLIEEAVRREKVRRTSIMLKEIAGGLSAYQRERGQFIDTDEMAELLDYLSPRYIPTPHRFDLWGKEFEYRGKATRYRLVSAGPDGKSGTKDDLIVENGVIRGQTE